MTLTLPNLLTLARIAAIPPAVALFFVGSPWADWTLLGLFSAAAATDWLDGYLARAMSIESRFGRFLDPVADKLLVAALLFMLAATGRLPDFAAVPAVIILLRELLISGLREFLADLRVPLPVSRLAKWKTAVQMIAIGLLIIGGPDGGRGLPSLPLDHWGAAALWLAGLLTVISGWAYMRAGLHHLVSND
jgi:cardiolipin synthase